ncbi:SpvB/TcaC N-terminal domain-containing protein [Paraburkholderia fungorum]|uniref:SpvB/TcaC N-terminal domain-containing protein n=1 Tax=Paraburkholderia fungorum TaxID=134537 RepID=UPI0038B8FC64
MSATLGQVGPTGMASMNLPLPVSSGRGYAPSITLNYSSGAGNGPFGIGWALNQFSISRRTSHGVPRYGSGDQFVGPDGEVLEPERDDGGRVITTSVSEYNSVKLDESYAVTRHYPRIEGSFDRIEQWVGATPGNTFWMIHAADGQLHCLGKTATARIADPAAPDHIAAWLSEESMSATGHHIYYRYRAEDGAGIDMSGSEALRDHETNRYLVEISYGNVTPSTDLFLFGGTAPEHQAWLFSLVFDYGERGMDSAAPPPYYPSTGKTWSARMDAFSRYDYGFELRNHRLCHQILMFHHFPEELGEPDTLVARLLLEYDDNPVLTRLLGGQQFAYEPDGAVQQLPPVEFQYTSFEFSPDAEQWQAFDHFSGLNDGHPYQMVDLYGEGIAGVLYRTDNLWFYRAPMRDGEVGGDCVSYGSWQRLPFIPAMQSEQMQLMDVNGDGKLDWLVTQPGLAGFFTLNPDGEWSGFTPFSALPVEFFHPQAELVNLVGAGMSDLALIGPRSVRLYANQRSGFAAGVDIGQSDDLPIARRDARELVAFSDMLGSGQQHLVRIRHDGVTVWPNLGRGQFGTPFQLASFSFDEGSFDPERIYLADLDGSGTADMIYVDSDQIHIYFNQAGNALDGPHDLPLPADIHFDRLCQLSVADVQGIGMASLVLTRPYLTTQHWCYNLAGAKPYLLNNINSNMGAHTEVTYRSSAQEWLDQKKECASSGGAAVSQLPFPVHLVCTSTNTDEITGNVLSQSYRYRGGVYDGCEQEFRGFGYVEAQDTNKDASSTGIGIAFSSPLQNRRWYHTGREEDETRLYGQPYQDSDAYTVNPTLLTQFDSGTQSDVTLNNPDEATRFWLYRALKGSALRHEVYGLDDDPNASVPYNVETFRYRVRQVQALASNPAAVALPTALEQTGYSYERISVDPRVSQQVTFTLDQFGAPLWSVGIDYPRRAQPASSPYPNALPAKSWDSSYDGEQQVLRLTEQRASVWHLTDPQQWRLGLPKEQRVNRLTYDASQVPSNGLNYESLTNGGLLGDSQARVYGGQNITVYQTTDGTPDFLALVDHSETAELDNTCIAAYDGILDSGTLSSMLESAGYTSSATVLPVSGAVEDPVWVVKHGFTTYSDMSGFYCPLTQQKTVLTGASITSYDSHYCAVTSIADAIGNTTTFAYDYRFLQPVSVVDINANHHEVQIDALGRTVASTFYGTENSRHVGFGTIADNPVPTDLTVSRAIAEAGASPQWVASIYAYDPFGWMGQISLADLGVQNATAQKHWRKLLALRFIDGQGHIRAAGRRWAQEKSSRPDLPKAVSNALAAAVQMPVNSAMLVADRYPGDAAQKIRVAVIHVDGFGRPLQSATKAVEGLAWQLGDDGEIVVDADGKPVEVSADPRWAISGRVEYDNKGQPVRSYQPYFINAWQYVVDSSMRTCGYADTHYYDATGREIRVQTALNYLRRQSYYPWFSVSEDENDTHDEPSMA